MKLLASATGEWPTGVHWTSGEVREISLPIGATLPVFLTPIQDTEPKTKKTKGD